jgi:hypothetical protein
VAANVGRSLSCEYHENVWESAQIEVKHPLFNVNGQASMVALPIRSSRSGLAQGRNKFVFNSHGCDFATRLIPFD